jgi:hydroxymethylpyrimidine/phosphomethylpyrimidine kinase
MITSRPERVQNNSHIGMLATAPTIEMLAEAFKEHKVEKIILDPVWFS